MGGTRASRPFFARCLARVPCFPSPLTIRRLRLQNQLIEFATTSQPGRLARKQLPRVRPPVESVMSLSPSLRPTREGPLLMLALALVLTVCMPLYQMFAPEAGD